MRNVGLDEAQAGIKIAGRKISNFRYTDDTILMAESKEELKNVFMKVKKESEQAGLKLNIQKTKIMAFRMMYFAYKLKKQGDHIQPCIPFSISNQSVVPCLILLLPVVHTDFSGGR